MSAIAGIIELDGTPAYVDNIQRMVEALVHRGPDTQRVWSHANAALAHCMLHSTPESLVETLPFENNGLHITADARIDNREELFSALNLRPTDGESVSDSALILQAYLAWGKECANRLLGDFAFAIWNPGKQQLFCARDHFGVKPFYYTYQANRRFLFSSSINGLHSISHVDHQIDEVKIVDYVLEQFDDKARTFFVGVSRLPPASILLVDRERMQIWEYWRLDPDREVRLNSDQEYSDEFRSIFFEAVKCRLRSAFPVGAMLSGGLDSSSVACVAHDLTACQGSPKELHTFSIVFDHLQASDERPFIDTVLRDERFLPHFIDGDPITPFDDLEQVLLLQDEPFCAPNYSLTRNVWQSASNNGVRVLLDGLFGDNVVSHGIEHLNELASTWRWFALANELKQLLETSNPKVPLWQPLGQYILQQGIKPYIPEAVLTLWRGFRQYPLDPTAQESKVFSSDFSARTGVKNRLRKTYANRRRVKSARHAHCESMASGMIQTALEIYSHGCSEFPLETRFPFIDKRLVEFCIAIPGQQKIGGGYTRAILRRALRGYLPKEIHSRTSKGDLGWSFIEGFLAQRKLVATKVGSSQGFLGRFFDLDNVNDMISRLDDNKIMPEEFFTLFLMVLLSTWGTGKYGDPKFAA